MILVYKTNINDISFSNYKTEYNSLSESEREYLSRYKTDGDIKRSLASKFLLRKAVFENFNKKDFSFKRKENGKIITDFCYLSLSHSSDMSVCAISDMPVGVDIEKIKPIKERKKYRFFTDEENEYVNSSSLPQISFLEIWTRKEAYLKCAEVKSAELSNISVKADFNGFSFKTEKEDGYIISVCQKTE